MDSFERELAEKVHAYEKPPRVALSSKYPLLKRPIIMTRRTLRNTANIFDLQISYQRKKDFFTNVVARHQSLLRRKLGDSDPRLQEQKIINLQKAAERLNGVVIEPGKVFSLWDIVGKPTRRKGYVNGMLLSNGKVVEGLGGGLCQLANFLFWIFMHAPVEVVERYHHSMDVFPDSGRTLPFGSGATILYNFVDLKIKNTSPYPLQLKIWLTDNHLKGQVLSQERIVEKYHVYEQNHCFVKKGDTYFRYNEIWRQKRVNGDVLENMMLVKNFAPVLYSITPEYLKENNFTVIDLEERNKTA